MTIEQEIIEHLSNPDVEEGEGNLGLLVVQEVGKAEDRAAKAAELDALIQRARMVVGAN